MAAASRSLGSRAPWRARFASSLLQPIYTAPRDTTRNAATPGPLGVAIFPVLESPKAILGPFWLGAPEDDPSGLVEDSHTKRPLGPGKSDGQARCGGRIRRPDAGLAADRQLRTTNFPKELQLEVLRPIRKDALQFGDLLSSACACRPRHATHTPARRLRGPASARPSFPTKRHFDRPRACIDSAT